MTFTAVSSQNGFVLNSYSWQVNGVAAGTANNPLTTSTFTQGSSLALIGTFGGCVTQGNLTVAKNDIVVKPNPLAAINPSGTVKICSTCDQQINAGPLGTGYSYAWRKTGGIIPVAISSNYITNVIGTYSADITYDGCTATSATMTLTKNSAPVPNAGVDKTIALPTTSTSLTGSASDSDGTIASYSWAKELGPSATRSGQTTATLSLSNLVAGNYKFRLDVTDNFGELASDYAFVSVYIPNNYNRIQDVSVNVPAIATEVQVTSLAIGSKQETWQYFDGLGRPMQNVVTKGSPGTCIRPRRT